MADFLAVSQGADQAPGASRRRCCTLLLRLKKQRVRGEWSREWWAGEVLGTAGDILRIMLAFSVEEQDRNLHISELKPWLLPCLWKS